MRKEFALIFLLFVFCFVFWFTSFVLNRIPVASYFENPYGDTFSIFSFLKKPERPTKIVYGYLPYWSLDKIKYLQLNRLTDIAYFGLSLEADGHIRTTLDDGTADPGWNNWKNSKELVKLIENSKKHEVRFAVTIISHEDDISDAFLNCRTCWDTFINDLIAQMDEKKIKDVNLNFEYTELTPKDMAHKYTEFTDFVNKRLDGKYGDSFVVVASFADSLVKNRVTLIDELSQVADSIFIMAYDFHQPTSDNAGPVAPINGIGVHSEYDISTMIKDYLKVAPPTKLILGVPYYGYNWVVASTDKYSERIPGNDVIGYSQSQTYSALMDTILENKPTIMWDALAQSPYFTYTSPATGSLRTAYFENEQSLKIKYDLAQDYNFAGIGIWALGYDGGYAELWNLLKEEFARPIE